jgi:hypothetical protein
MPYFFLKRSGTGVVSADRPTSPARAISLSRASSAARFTARPMWYTEREPSVPMSYGVTSVSGWTTLTASTERPSTSAAICTIAVSEPCPMSTVPQYRLALPSA